MSATHRLDFQKVTGPIEHWVTTFHTGYWGFRPDKQAAWEAIRPGQAFLFHASKSEFLDVPPSLLEEVGTGIIGFGRVANKRTKEEAAWWQEIHGDGTYPYLIDLEDIVWFGQTDEIRDVPVAEKDTEEMIADVHHLAANIISFPEMRSEAGYQIPAQGSPMNVSQPEKLFPLIRSRLDASPETEAASSATESSERTASINGSAEIRERAQDRNLDPNAFSDEAVEYTPSLGDTIAGTIDHEEALDIFETYLAERGLSGGETTNSDLISFDDGAVVLAEAKSIHGQNERSQIRRGIGQVLEYAHTDIATNVELAGKERLVCLLLSRPPSEPYRPVLQSLTDRDIHTFWVDDGGVAGLESSMRTLSAITDS
ncbi:hypothetical protein [Halosegnis marinus]|uniref:EVE domain-containing protein n=1 Tax=Halosegnis marinus TaxID=3034023 RepID=A0ABD5ZTB3_9EURY|nr:hypothetical protein [Halosegnis sp. DT85]